ncbi:hypothetical protein WN944_026712 [Citrus x changshan-huyou]|uniref:Uncharacterized protein n=1 Tax=Citrus x changshan-huyou TaxID=2935761 RepID=A0AAP0QE56_9ROSI
MEIHFPDWMSELSRGIFKKYPSVGERYAHAPENVPPVDKWMDEGWKFQLIHEGDISTPHNPHSNKYGIKLSVCQGEQASKARMCMVLQVKEDIVLTGEDDDGYEDDEVEANDSETEVVLEDD